MKTVIFYGKQLNWAEISVVRLKRPLKEVKTKTVFMNKYWQIILIVVDQFNGI